MNSKITYRIGYEPHPWNAKERKEGGRAWCLIKVVTPEMGPASEEPVAIFNYNSESELFQGHVLSSGLDGKLVTIDPMQREMFERIAAARAK